MVAAAASDLRREPSDTSALGEVCDDLRLITTGLRFDKADVFATKVGFLRPAFCGGSRLVAAVTVAGAPIAGVNVVLAFWTAISGTRIRVVLNDEGSPGVAHGFSAWGFLRIDGRGVLVWTLSAAEGTFSASL